MLYTALGFAKVLLFLCVTGELLIGSELTLELSSSFSFWAEDLKEGVFKELVF